MYRSIMICAAALAASGCIDLPGDVVIDGGVDQAVAPLDMQPGDGGPLDGAVDQSMAGCPTRWPLLSSFGPAERHGQPTVTDVDDDGYRDLLIPTAVDGENGVRIAFGGPCGLSRARTIATAARPWRAVVGRFDGATPTLVTLERSGPVDWALRSYPLDAPADVTTWQIPDPGLREESFAPERPLLMLATPLDDQPGDELLFGSYYYLYSALGPGLDPPDFIRPPGESTYFAQDLAALGDGRVFMLEEGRWRIFEWSADLDRLDGGAGELLMPTYRTMASSRREAGLVIAGGFAIDSAQFMLFDAARDLAPQPYWSERHPTSEIVGLAVGGLRGRAALDVAALIRPPGGNPTLDESTLLACLDARDGACSSWIDQQVRGPFPWFVSGDFDSPIGTPSSEELLLLRAGEAEIECWRIERVELLDRFVRCE